MVVRVLEVELDDVVVHVLDGALHLHARHVQLLELHARHRARGVLEQRLVDAQADRLARLELAVDEVLLEDLPGQVRHSATNRPSTLAVARSPVASTSTNWPTGTESRISNRRTSPPANVIAS